MRVSEIIEGLITGPNEPHFEISDPDNKLEQYLAKHVPAIYKKLKTKYGNPIGAGRNRVTFKRGNIVIKVPKNELGIHDNMSEARTYKKWKGHEKEDFYARSKIIRISDIPILLMIHVDISTKGLSKEERPWFADFVDSMQIGTTRKGEWKAYDYGWN